MDLDWNTPEILAPIEDLPEQNRYNLRQRGVKFSMMTPDGIMSNMFEHFTNIPIQERIRPNITDMSMNEK